jgi:glycopeptide antibiotics resistance protein
MLPFMLVSLPFIAVSRFLFIRKAKKSGLSTTFWHEFWLIVFILFLVGLASLTVLPHIYIKQDGIRFAFSGNDSVNLIPGMVLVLSFRAFKYRDYYFFLINFVGNIIMFMPIGFFPPLLWRKKNHLLRAIACGFFSSLFIELVQLSLNRDTDIDDLLLNTLGAFLGYIVFIVLNKAFTKHIEHSKMVYYDNL